MTVTDAPQPARAQGYARGRARRQQILDAAMALFGEVGYRSASLREIAARSGISHPGLLHHFSTKEELLLAVLQRRDDIDSAEFSIDGDDGVGTLRSVLELVARNTQRRGVVELYAALSAEATTADHPAHAYFVQRYRTTLTTMTRAFEDAGRQGALRAGIHPGHAASQLIALMDGLQVQWLLDDTTDMPAVVRAQLESQLSVGL
ncbi:MAG: TetR/AcrR family transcriptional regulator [Microbacteriaceae bacterium]|nr:TetR/AcrR family transcriptional regulator [Microbacteriaceae bacterium]MCL2795004.1 TetR/AcrR family transcriptional regulator [Microbacteriaceae bacterium]